MSKEINFQVLKDNGQVVVFSLVPRPETYAERFCLRLHSGLLKKEAVIKVIREEIIFCVPIGPKTDEFRAKVEAEDLAAISKLLDDDKAKNPELIVKSDPLDLTCCGFRVTLPGYEKFYHQKKKR